MKTVTIRPTEDVKKIKVDDELNYIYRENGYVYSTREMAVLELRGKGYSEYKNAWKDKYGRIARLTKLRTGRLGLYDKEKITFSDGGWLITYGGEPITYDQCKIKNKEGE